MIVLIVLAALAIAFALVARFSRDFSGWDLVGTLGLAFSAIGLLIALAGIPMNRMDVRAQLAEFNAVRDSRAGGAEIEAAAWRMKVAESNAWLASTKFYDHTIFDLWIPDEIESVEPIR